MAYDSTSPANDDYLADFPPKMREQLRAIIDDQIVNALKLQGLIPANTTGNIPVSNGNVNTNLNADLLDGKHSTSFADAAHTHSSATQQAAGLMAAADKTKLDGIATGAEVNQNAFSNVVYGSTTIQADSKTDTLTLAAGANILITPDATNDKVTIGVTGTVDKAADCSGNAATATKLATARAIALSGKATGTVTFDGSADVSINVTAVSADSAANDANGNDIAATYATQTALTNAINNIQVFTGATSGAAGTAGLVPSPASGYNSKYLKGDGSWSDIFPTDKEVSSTNANAFRAVFGSYGFFIRNDGGNVYFMVTNSGDPYGTGNDFRPIMIELPTGKAVINGITFGVD